ncbi:hypothetical protein [Acinetobacter bohemicus]|uniref:hypothetical protein n=1 Tax=Acinetobacter bohemicus TaxID=1435036 RepID=UPI00192AB598|nr:hypothetical protein [Acinetobacter bohemicus]CAD9193995.1 hypothetical protein QAC21B_00080 [Acinetobacter bohemicus]
MKKVKIKAEGEKCQAAYIINNHSISRAHMQNLCDWVMIGSGVLSIFSMVCLFFTMHDFWSTMLCLIMFGFGVCLFFFAFFPYLYLEYGVKKSD